MFLFPLDVFRKPLIKNKSINNFQEKIQNKGGFPPFIAPG